ncbi:Bax inhibitor-1/YccA family protein [Myceligenerans indicum]|uniref:Bax inhibitor-1/YccA family protein n=1 Tax=Myceligenerans indicum TaxID=2593663 RepID=A0ABS1LHD1_9MICO|nr:Bax inhibitor-1/YccA family protein [Myceligenerans indicum]MBL0885636.1 Bax inhibitor-1/YccA family protein [Myceligenerans indicum]
MSNPVFSNSDVFGEPRRTGAPRGARGGTATAPNPYSQYGTAGPASMDASQLGAMYDAPSATTADTKRLTYDDVIVKTGGLLALLVVVAAATFVLAPGLMWIGLIGGLILGLVNAFKRNPSPFLIIAYTVFQGMFVGGISYVYNGFAEGAITQAVIGTLVTFVGALLLFRSGKVRVTAKFTRWLMIAMIGYVAFALINFVLVAFGVLDGWGLRSGPIGIVIGLIAIGLAAASLIVDFDSIKRGVEAGAPAKMAWAAAFGLLVTLIWLYLEFLRLAAIFASSD